MLTAYEGELSAEERALLESHLAGCEGCRLRALDFRAAEGIVGEALLAEAAEVDFSRFADQVMERVARAPAPVAPAPVRPPARPERRPAPRAGIEGRAWPRILSWARAHRAAAVAGTLAPTLAAAALIVYLATSGTAASRLGEVEVVAEGRVPMVLQTSEGPVVLLDEPGGT
jgi:anti-sigma factor RsiW